MVNQTFFESRQYQHLHTNNIVGCAHPIVGRIEQVIVQLEEIIV